MSKHIKYFFRGLIIAVIALLITGAICISNVWLINYFTNTIGTVAVQKIIIIGLFMPVIILVIYLLGKEE